jgi:hypothetical protein
MGLINLPGLFFSFKKKEKKSRKYSSPARADIHVNGNPFFEWRHGRTVVHQMRGCRQMKRSF